MTIKELREKSLKVSNEAKALLDTITDENRSEKEAEFTRMMDSADAYAAQADRLDAAEKREKAFEEIETEIAPETRQTNTNKVDAEAEFRSFLRTGELRAQAGDVESMGQVLVPTSVHSKIIESMADYGPFSDGGPVTLLVTGTGAPINIPTADNTGGTGTARSENDTAIAKDHTISSVPLTVQTYDSGFFQVSNELIRDSEADIVSFIVSNCAENLGRKVNEVHTTNLLAGASNASFTAALAGEIASDELLKLAYDVNGAYRRKGGFMFNSKTELAIRLLKDADQNYLWQPAFAADKPNTVAGFSYWTNDDMPDLAASATAIAFGDFSRFYVRRAGAVEVKRADELFMRENAVGFCGFISEGSAVVDAKAIKYLTQAA